MIPSISSFILLLHFISIDLPSTLAWNTTVLGLHATLLYSRYQTSVQQCEHPASPQWMLLIYMGFQIFKYDRNEWVKEFFLKVGGKPCRGFKKTDNKVAKIAVGKKLYMENYRILMKD